MCCSRGVKVLSGYSSNIACDFNSDKIGGLKSHDYHVLMQQLLSVAVRNWDYQSIWLMQ